MNYLIIVNKLNLIDNDYFDNLELVECENIYDETARIEKKTYDAYLRLKEHLKNKNIFVEVDSGYRSIEKQQEIIDEFTLKYGVEYAKTHVAPIRESEHHTGLAIDLALIIDGKKCIENEDLYANEEIFQQIHKELDKFGFILRYPKGKEKITGYDYEPWHIRYVGIENARKIYNNKQTLEEYIEQYNRININ